MKPDKPDDAVLMICSVAIRKNWMLLLGDDFTPLWEGPQGTNPPNRLQGIARCCIISPEDYDDMLRYKMRKEREH